jgi:hypothetical protein
MCKMTQEVGSQKLIGQMECGQSTNVGLLRLKIRCKTNSRRLQESLWRKRSEFWPDKSIVHHDSAPVYYI